MNAAHLHLMLNHFPLMGMFFAVLLLGFGIWRDNEVIKRAGLVFVVLTGLLTIPVFLTGHPAEEVIEHLPDITEARIEEHEEFAHKLVWLVWTTSALALAGLIQSFRTARAPKWATRGVLLLVLASLGAVAWTNNLGGKIHHPETREDFKQP